VKKFGESFQVGKQMTADKRPAGAPTGKYIKWNSINWKEVNIFVKRLQMCISKAVKKTAGQL